MNQYGNNSPSNGERNPFEHDCSQCAGFCCIALEIPEGTDGVLRKTANEVCWHLSMNPSGTWHACKAYERRKFIGYDTCMHYSCHGAGNLVTKESEKRGWIREDGTFDDAARDLYDIWFRLAKFLEAEREAEASFLFRFGKRKPDEFRDACERIYARMLDDGQITDADGNPSDYATVRDWFVHGMQLRNAMFSRVVTFFDRWGK